MTVWIIAIHRTFESFNTVLVCQDLEKAKEILYAMSPLTKATMYCKNIKDSIYYAYDCNCNYKIYPQKII